MLPQLALGTLQSRSRTTPRPSTRAQRRALAGAFVLLAASSSAAGADITTTWLSASSGTWSNAANWSAGVPNNGTQTFAAIIGATGIAYTVTLNSNITVNDFTLNSADATVNHTSGTFSALASPIHLAAGSYRLAGGTIAGGSITFGGGTLIFTSSAGILSNTSILGDVSFSESSARARFQAGADFTGSATLSAVSSILNYEHNATIGAGRVINLDNSSADLSVGGTNTLTISAGATVRGRGEVRSDLFVSGDGHVVNNGMVSADIAAARLTVSPDTFINNATVRSINSASLTISAASFTNNGLTVATDSHLSITGANWSNAAGGTISVSGGTGTLGGNWTNAGVISVTNSTLNLGGTFSTASTIPARLIRSGGTVNLTGFLDNSAATLNLDASTGSWRLLGGTVSGGTIVRSGGADLIFTSSAGILSNTSIVGDVSFSESAARARFQAGADFTGSATLSAASSILNYEHNATIGAGRVINLDNSSADLSVGGTNTLTIGAGATVRGRGEIRSDLFVSGDGTVVNHGIIRADIGGGTLSVSPDAMINGSGALRASNGGKLIVSNLSGNLNATAADGTNSLIRLAAGTYTINQLLAVTGHATLNLKGNWTKSATIDASGRIIFDYDVVSPLPAIRAQILSGYNGGLWNGSGINSSAAAANPGFAVGYAESAVIVGIAGGTFSGESVDGSAVLIRYTRYGDADLNGLVNLIDFNRLAANFGQSDRDWTQGDFNYDGLVNLSDFNRLAANFGLQAGPDGPTPDDWAALASAVPEPGAAALLGLGLLPLVRRRRG